MYEGTFNFPIPIAGISMADFDFRHTDAQLSTFFAGPILATDLSKQYGTKYRLAADLALSALPGERSDLQRQYREHRGKRSGPGSRPSELRASWQAGNHLSLPHSPIWPMTSFAEPATRPTNMRCRATAWPFCPAFNSASPKEATSSLPTAPGENVSTGSNSDVPHRP